MKTKNTTSKSIEYKFTDEDVGTRTLTFPNINPKLKSSKIKNKDIKTV